MILVKGVLKICSKITGEYLCQSVVSIKLLCKFIEITLWYGCSPVNLLDTFRTYFTKKTSEWLLLYEVSNESIGKKCVNYIGRIRRYDR